MKFILMICVFFLISCSGGQPRSTNNYVDSAFTRANKLACSIKYKANEDYCECHVRALDSITPHSVKQKVLAGKQEATRELVRVMLQNKDVIDRCNVHHVVDLKIIEIPDSQNLEMIKSKYSGSILDLEGSTAFDYSKLQLGFEYTLQNVIPSKDGALSEARTYRLTDIKGDDYIFSVFNSAGEVVAEGAYIWRDGLQYQVYQSSGDVGPAELGSECKYTIGECSYQSGSGAKRVVYSEYRDGVWLRNEKGMGKSRRPVKQIYDKYGIPLYYYSKSLGEIEKIRIK